MKFILILFAAYVLQAAFHRLFPKAHRTLIILKGLLLMAVWIAYGIMMTLMLHRLARLAKESFQLDPPQSITSRQEALTKECIVEVHRLDHKIWFAAILGPFSKGQLNTVENLLGVCLSESHWTADECSLWLHCARHSGPEENAYMDNWATLARTKDIQHPPQPQPAAWISE